jgi:protein-S-isoprenylcysteine O-methyltransferase Ste14
MSDINPRLQKKRQFHTRVFLYSSVVFVFLSKPVMLEGTFPRECMMWLGYVLIVIGALGRAYCSVYIGGRKNEEVVRGGPFSVVRNPLYVFSFLAIAGVGLQSGTFFIFALLLAAFLAYYPMVIAKEEAFLSHKFGEEYESYKNSVPRWFPNFKLWSEPEQLHCQPRLVRKTLLDAAVFFLPMPCFAIIHALQTNEILPVWFMLP